MKTLITLFALAFSFSSFAGSTCAQNASNLSKDVKVASSSQTSTTSSSSSSAVR